MENCRRAGIHEENIIGGRGPFSLDDNLSAIRRYDVGVIVTKDSGVAGGVQEKIEAARIAGCRMVVLQRPKESGEATFSSISELIDAVSGLLGRLQAPGG
jgi:precorrin-6x reductase